MKELISSIILLLCFVSCEPDDTFKGITDPPTEVRYMNDTLKTYYFFKVGSWWIYQRTDTAATIYDTATLVHDKNINI